MKNQTKIENNLHNVQEGKLNARAITPERTVRKRTRIAKKIFIPTV